MKEELARIIAGYTENRNYIFELLYFWAWHPFTQLDRLAVVHLLEDGEHHLETALDYLLENQVIQTTSQNNISFFSLTAAEPLRTQVLSLCRRNLMPPFAGAKASPTLERGVFPV